jgi:predicted neutral ceramidase superfamily lipid hydrolase
MVILYICVVILIVVSVLFVILATTLVWNERDSVNVILFLLSLIPFLMSIYIALCTFRFV